MCSVDVKEYDVAIISGGSSSTYAAIQLQQAGKSVAVVERNDRLGGHVNTYVDPITNQTMDYGVISYINTTTAREYFSHLGVPTEAFLGFTRHPKTDNVTALWADFAAATAVPDGSQLKSQNETIDVANYTRLEKGPEYISWTGGTGYTYLPDPVPEKLLLPFGQWLEMHNFSAIAYQEWYQGTGNALQQMTLYMLKYINQDYADGRLIIGHHNNQVLHDTALARLRGSNSASSVFLNSYPTRITRSSSDGVDVTFDDHSSCECMVRERQLLIAIPSLYENLQPFLDMHATEAALFSKFINITYWAALLTDTDMPAYTGISNVVIDAEANIPGPVGNLGITPSSTEDRDLHARWWVSKHQYTRDKVSQLLIESSSNALSAFNFTPPAGKAISVAALDDDRSFALPTHSLERRYQGRVLQGFDCSARAAQHVVYWMSVGK